MVSAEATLNDDDELLDAGWHRCTHVGGGVGLLLCSSYIPGTNNDYYVGRDHFTSDRSIKNLVFGW